ncbi:MAG: general secretion pathway protein GspB [Candidatus Thiodiazotropha sp.]
MSSILDALEKAEEERIRELSPGLRPARRKGKGRHRRLPAIAAGVALLLLINLLLWWFYLRAVPESEPAVASREVRASESDAAPPRVAQPAPPKPAEKPALSLHQQLMRNAAPSAKPLIEEALVSRKTTPAPVAIPAPPVKTAEPVQEATAATASMSTPPAEPLQATALDMELVRAEPAPTPVERQPPAVPAVATPPLTASTDAALSPSGKGQVPLQQTPQQEQEEIPLVWELPQTLREKVLQLKSSVHVYSEVPAQRFVIINMRRYAEGDSLPPDDFRLARIDQDGVVIDYGDGLVRLPRR